MNIKEPTPAHAKVIKKQNREHNICREKVPETLNFRDFYITIDILITVCPNTENYPGCLQSFSAVGIMRLNFCAMLRLGLPENVHERAVSKRTIAGRADDGLQNRKCYGSDHRG